MRLAPLTGRQVVVTRRCQDVVELLRLLEQAGARCLCAPMIAFAEPRKPDLLAQAQASLVTYDLLLLTSRQAARAFCHGASFPEGNGPKICAVGQATATELHANGWPVDIISDGSGAEQLVQMLADGIQLEGSRALFPCSDLALPTLVDRLRLAGAQVDIVIAYRTVPPPAEAGDVLMDLINKSRPVVIFASPSAVTGWAGLLKARMPDLWTRIDTVAIGATTYKALHNAGATRIEMAARPDAQSLVQAAIASNNHETQDAAASAPHKDSP